MSETVWQNQGRVRKALLPAMSLLLLAACGQQTGEYIEHGKPATVLEKEKDSRWIAGQGYDHWETDFYFTLQQCDRDDEQADEHGCTVVRVSVSAPTYGEFEDGDSIVFKRDMYEANG